MYTNLRPGDIFLKSDEDGDNIYEVGSLHDGRCYSSSGTFVLARCFFGINRSNNWVWIGLERITEAYRR